MLVATPRPPMSMRIMMIRRRTGCSTTASDSLVVKPAPVRAERAWKRAAGRAMPVRVRAIVAMRVMSSDRMATTTSRTTAYMCHLRSCFMPERRVADAMIPDGSSIAPAQRHDPTVHAGGRVLSVGLQEPAPADDRHGALGGDLSGQVIEQGADPACTWRDAPRSGGSRPPPRRGRAGRPGQPTRTLLPRCGEHGAAGGGAPVATTIPAG